MQRSRWCVPAVLLALIVAQLGVFAADRQHTGRRTSRSATKARERSRARLHAKREARGVGRRGRRHTSRHGRRHRTAYSGESTVPVSPGIPAERVIEIQGALIRLGYLEGPASGQYDDPTTDAMRRFQADNGLSRSGLPSALALKKLGVSKHSNDGYSAPVKSRAGEPKPSAQAP